MIVTACIPVLQSHCANAPFPRRSTWVIGTIFVKAVDQVIVKLSPLSGNVLKTLDKAKYVIETFDDFIQRVDNAGTITFAATQ